MSEANFRKDLTVLLLVKGRDLHTLRWMWHANRIGFKYPILIGDGGDNPVSRRVLSNNALFPNLDYQYLQYNDSGYYEYFKKVADITSRANTPFVFRADNDDFILPSGLERALDFMRGHPDFVWCASPLVHFTIHGGDQPAANLVGDLYRLVLEGRIDAYQSEDPMVRLRTFLTHCNLQIYYAVVRREHFQHIYDRKVALSPRNLDLSDMYKRMLSLLGGRHKVILDSTLYMHQTDTSQIHAAHGHFADRLFHNDLMGDFDRLVGDLAAHAGEAHGAEVDKAIRDLYVRNMKAKLAKGENPGRTRNSLRNLGLARRFRLSVDDRHMKRQLMAAGATPQAISALEGDIEAVRRDLEGTDFLAFLRDVAPEVFGATAHS